VLVIGKARANAPDLRCSRPSPPTLAAAADPLSRNTHTQQQNVQYVCMFLNNGEPGQLKKVQASVTAARKVFRVMRVSLNSWGFLASERDAAAARCRLPARACSATRTLNPP
jgi:hypothetical protein